MKRNNNTDNTYRQIEHNGSRVKILDKTLYRIKYNNHLYIVPRAEKLWGTTTLFNMNIQRADTGHYHNPESGTLWIREEKEGNLIIGMIKIATTSLGVNLFGYCHFIHHSFT